MMPVIEKRLTIINNVTMIALMLFLIVVFVLKLIVRYYNTKNKKVKHLEIKKVHNVVNKSFKKTEINIRFPSWKTKALTFSYDDGVYADEHLIDIFNKYGLKGTFNINSGNIGANAPLKYGHARLDEDAVSKLYTKSGHEIAMHTLTHPFLSKWILRGLHMN